MSEINIDPKIESLKNRTLDFVTHERENVTDFSGKLLGEVEGIMIESVEAASAKLDSMLNRVAKVVKKEPFVVIAAIAISGLALVNALNRKPGEKAPTASPPSDESLRH